MKRFTLPLAAGAALFAIAVPMPMQAQATGTPMERLQKLKADRAKLLEQQASTIQKLEALDKDAQQLRIFARRT
jgi:hypothetical protein